MNLQGIISISGKAGLFKVIAQGKNNVIVESLEDGKRFPAFASDQISALDDISIYTFTDDVPLKEVYQTMFEKYEGKVGPKFKSPLKELRAEFLEILPEYDDDRVHDSDIKKIFKWYNLLHKSDLLASKEAEPVKEKVAVEKVEKEKPAKKESKKK